MKLQVSFSPVIEHVTFASGLCGYVVPSDVAMATDSPSAFRQPVVTISPPKAVSVEGLRLIKVALAVKS
jgi:hypothetical protein